MKGKIHWFNKKKGFGFIIDEKENHIYVQSTEPLEADRDVEFDTFEGPKGTEATNVRVL